jgi:hypothetical protein
VIACAFWHGSGAAVRPHTDGMDAGVAALLGALVGSATTLGAAVVNGRMQARVQHVQWRRQHRRDAYVTLLSALHDRDIAMDAILEALRAQQPDRADLDEKVARFIDLAREAHRAVEIVIVEGPPVMVDAADRVIRASEDLSATVRPLVANAHAGTDTDRASDLDRASQQERLLYRAIVDLRTTASEVLNATK